MSDSLLSVGLDVGTTTTQLILSRLQIENRASGFAVPQMQIVGSDIIYRSKVHFTPLQDTLVDTDALKKLVSAEYENAGITPSQVDTGAVIITGETSRKENAALVLSAISGFAGDFVAATAGPDLESRLAAQGAGATAYSEKTGKQVLHIDIGGGTSNFALCENGKIIRTGCLNVGGRLLKKEKNGKITYVSPVLSGLTDLQPGDYATPQQIEAIAQILTHGLEMAAGLRPVTQLMDKLATREVAEPWVIPPKGAVLSFSGGVAACMENPTEDFGDMGKELAQAIKNSLLCREEYVLGRETIRATVIGAGCHSARLSGSTVFCSGVDLPLKNLPVVTFDAREQEREDLPQIIAQRRKTRDESRVLLYFPGYENPSYRQLTGLARRLSGAEGELLICLQSDMAKALGQRLRVLLPGTPILCIDSIPLSLACYLDIGKPVGPALPVVVKTLVLENGGSV